MLGLGWRWSAVYRPALGGTVTSSLLVVPYWLMCFLAGVLPVWRGAARLRTPAPAARGAVPVVRVRLAETPERCPECGTSPGRDGSICSSASLG